MSFHILTQYMNAGSSYTLSGDVYFSFVYVSDGESKWTAADEKNHEAVLKKLFDYFKKEAHADRVNLRMFRNNYYLNDKIVYTKDNYETMAKNFANKHGFSSMESFNEHVCNQHVNIQHIVVFLLNKQARSFAVSTSERYSKKPEYCVVFGNNLYSVLHEMMHIFGASDYYYPEKVKNAAASILGKSVMLNYNCEVIDDLTRYVIGWHATPTPKAQKLLDATADITYEEFRKSLSDAWRGSK